MYIIYALVDPRDNKVRYVGMTSDVYKRFIDHIQCSGGNYEKNTWMHEMRKSNVMVQMVELERVDEIESARTKEGYWINHFITLKHPMLNIQCPSPRVASLGRSAVSEEKSEELTNFSPDDYLMDDKQIELFTAFYQAHGNISKSLEMIKNRKGQGLGRRYFKHASLIVKQKNLRRQ